MQPGPYSSPAPLPPAMSAPQVRPAKSWFVVAGLIAVVGIIVAVVILVLGITSYADRVDDFDRADLPATLQVEITDTGGYSIYHEYDGADGDDFSFSSQPDVSVTDPSGDPVALDPYVGSITYSASGHEGEGLYTFDADEPGTYEITAQGESGDGIAVGRGIGRGLVAAIVGSLAVGLVAVLAGAVLAIVVGVRRSSNRRALMPPPHFSGWSPPPPPGWGGPPGPAGGYGTRGGGYGAGGHGAGGDGSVPPPAPPPPPSSPSDAPAPPAPSPPPPPSGPSDAPAPPAPSPPPPPSGPSDSPAPPADSSSPPAPGGSPGAPAPPADSSSPPGLGASGRPSAFGVAGPRASRPGAPAMRRRTAAPRPVADPPSLRAPVDWARSDVPLPWSPSPDGPPQSSGGRRAVAATAARACPAVGVTRCCAGRR